jgi:hypothetical protein
MVSDAYCERRFEFSELLIQYPGNDTLEIAADMGVAF